VAHRNSVSCGPMHDLCGREGLIAIGRFLWQWFLAAYTIVWENPVSLAAPTYICRVSTTHHLADSKDFSEGLRRSLPQNSAADGTT
jgi:hypothetical protein